MARIALTDLPKALRPPRVPKEPCARCGQRICQCLENTLAGLMRDAGLPTPARQYRWHPTRQYRADFAFVAARLLVEVQGGTWTNAGHGQGSGIERDAVKTCEAAIHGWYLLPVTSSMIRKGEALALIERALREHGMPTEEPKPEQGAFAYPAH